MVLRLGEGGIGRQAGVGQALAAARQTRLGQLVVQEQALAPRIDPLELGGPPGRPVVIGQQHLAQPVDEGVGHVAAAAVLRPQPVQRRIVIGREIGAAHGAGGVVDHEIAGRRAIRLAAPGVGEGAPQRILGVDDARVLQQHRQLAGVQRGRLSDQGVQGRAQGAPRLEVADGALGHQAQGLLMGRALIGHVLVRESAQRQPHRLIQRRAGWADRRGRGQRARGERQHGRRQNP